MVTQQPRQSHHSWTYGFFLGVSILTSAGYLYFFLFGLQLDALVALCSDDAFYYFKIARNIVHGQGCTFDGIAPTNGFHPAWMVCILPVFWLFPADLETPVRIVLAGNGLLCAATLILVYRLVHGYVAKGVGSVAVAACLLPNVLFAMTNGMETGLALCAVATLLWLCFRKRIHDPTAGPGLTVMFGLCLGVICLCRLDMVFLFVAAVLLALLDAVLHMTSFRASVARLAALGSGFALVVSPYLIWNFAYFGHVMPVSGAIKSSFPSVREPLELHDDMFIGAALLVGMWFLVIVLVLVDPDKCRRVVQLVRAPITLLLVACTCHFAHAFLFLTWGVYWWHFAVYGLTFGFILAQTVDRFTLSYPRARRIAIGGIVISTFAVAAGLTYHALQIKAAQHRAWLDGANWARRHTPKDTIFAIKDAGLFGYFSDRRTINLDGKANGYAYRVALYDGDVQGYLRSSNVEYIADIRARYRNGTYSIVIPRASQTPVFLTMDESQEVYRSDGFEPNPRRFGDPTRRFFAVWSVPSMDVSNANDSEKG